MKNNALSDNMKGIIYVVVSTIGFSVIPILAKIGFNSGSNSTTMLFYRFLIATIIFLAYMCFKKQNILLTNKKLYLPFILSSLAYGTQCLLFFSAFKYISPSIGELIYYIYPIFVTISAFFFLGEPIHLRKVICILLSIIGCGFILLSPWDHIQLKGIFMVIMASIMSTIYITMNKKVLSHIDSLTVTAYVSFGCSIYYLIYGTSTHTLELCINLKTFICILVLAFWSTIIGLFAFLKGLSLIGASKASIISLIEPLMTVLLSFIIFSTTLTVNQVIGGILIILSIYLFEKKSSKQKTPEQT
ncbi:MAG: DMT family transporter [Marinisporobacter sp.]|jgi:drug/metabolite transporter (DMT)-like permease|nr:DMT family transporter [Marinisporobacter sp.]